MVPAPHGQWLAEHVPARAPRFHDRHGHVSLMTEDHGEVLDDLLALRRVARARRGRAYAARATDRARSASSTTASPKPFR